MTDHYPLLTDAAIGIFWKTGWRAEADTGRIKLWKSMKANEMFREITGTLGSPMDLMILLNAGLWEKMQERHRLFVIDSALREFEPDRDRDGEQKEDDAGRMLWRVVKPTIQTFPDVVLRHGFVTRELQEIAKLAQKKGKITDKDLPLFDQLDAEGEAEKEEAA